MLCMEFGKPQRKFVDSREKLLQFIRSYNHRADCYQTVYKYTAAETIGWRTRPVYDTAKVNCIFLDFDGEDTLNEVLRVHSILSDEDLAHYIHFSGGGFHLYVNIDTNYDLINKSAAIKRYSLGLSAMQDTHIAGDLSRLCRIPYTYHIRKQRYCVPITENDLQAGLKEIIYKSTHLSDTEWQVFGDTPLNLEKWDYPEEEEEFEDDFEVDVEAIPLDGVPACVNDAMNAFKPNYWQRFIYFAYMRECGISMKSAIKMVQGKWRRDKLRHSIYEERQPQTIYQGRLLVPSRHKVDHYGFCKRCGLCIGD